MSDTTVQCPFPRLTAFPSLIAAGASAPLFIEISVGDGSVRTTNGLFVTLAQFPVITTVWPQFIHATGGNQITVTGSYFTTASFCQFSVSVPGNTSLPASLVDEANAYDNVLVFSVATSPTLANATKVLSSTSIVCRVPEAIRSLVSMLTTNFHHDAPVLRDEEVRRVPAHQPVTGSLYNASTTSWPVWVAVLDVNLNTFNVSSVANRVAVAVVLPPLLSGVWPPFQFEMSPVALALTLTGANFLPTATLACRIGMVFVVPATFLSSSSIVCGIAPARLFTRPGRYLLEVTLNGQDYSAWSNFSLHQTTTAMTQRASSVYVDIRRQPTISAVVPSFVPATLATAAAGGMTPSGLVLTIVGSDLVNALASSSWLSQGQTPLVPGPLASVAWCVFNTSIVAAATVLNDTALLCTLPALPGFVGTMPVQVTLDAGLSYVPTVQGTYRAVTLTLFVPPVTLTLSMARGPVTGGVLVTVYGQSFNYVNGVACNVDNFVYLAATTVLSSTAVACVMPQHAAGAVAVKVFF